MKVLEKFSFTGLITLLLKACIKTGPKFTELSSRMSKVSPDLGRIYLYRTSFLGAAIQPEVKLNGFVIGKAVPNGFFYVDRAPGNYIIKTSTYVDRKLSFILDSGQTHFVRLNVSRGVFIAYVYPELVGFDEGIREIQDCGYVGKEK